MTPAGILGTGTTQLCGPTTFEICFTGSSLIEKTRHLYKTSAWNLRTFLGDVSALCKCKAEPIYKSGPIGLYIPNGKLNLVLHIKFLRLPLGFTSFRIVYCRLWIIPNNCKKCNKCVILFTDITLLKCLNVF